MKCTPKPINVFKSVKHRMALRGKPISDVSVPTSAAWSTEAERTSNMFTTLRRTVSFEIVNNLDSKNLTP